MFSSEKRCCTLKFDAVSCTTKIQLRRNCEVRTCRYLSFQLCVPTASLFMPPYTLFNWYCEHPAAQQRIFAMHRNTRLSATEPTTASKPSARPRRVGTMTIGNVISGSSVGCSAHLSASPPCALKESNSPGCTSIS